MTGEPHLQRFAVVAGVLAAICVLGGLYGAIGAFMAGSLALMFLPRSTIASGSTVAAKPDFHGFIPWFVCTGLFAAFVVVLMPMTEHPAITLGLLFFSPFFGTMVLLIESALAFAARRRTPGGAKSA